jgi:dimeric dUTPase (all-alpha-NTP-PPase superfamily)
MNVGELFQIQRELDQKITKKHQLQEQDLTPAKIIALQVELGELANETRCFKFWSLKEASPRNVILEEYVDGLHFVLSLGLDKRYEDRVEVTLEQPKATLLHSFSHAFDSISNYAKEQTLSQYQKLFQAIISLGQALGFTWGEIEQAYLEKNQVNHTRQEQGY